MVNHYNNVPSLSPMVLENKDITHTHAHVLYPTKTVAEQMRECCTSWEYVCYFLKIWEEKEHFSSASILVLQLSPLHPVYICLYFHSSPCKTPFMPSNFYCVLFTLSFISPSIFLSCSSSRTHSSCYEAN